MAQNYNINSSFGYNVIPKNTGAASQNTEIEMFSGSSVDKADDFFSKYENVFNGNIEKEINLYSRQMMIIGMNLKAADDTVRRFDMSI